MKELLFLLLSCCLGILGCKEQPKKTAETQSPVSETMNENQDTGPEVIPVEHATAVLDWGGTTVYIDPVGGAAAFEGQATPDLVLITDIHGDHMSAETLQGLDLSNATVIAPKAVADQLPEEVSSHVTAMANGETGTFKGIAVEAIPMYNLREEALSFHEKGRGNGYVLSKGGVRVYFSGDTEDIPEMRGLKEIDMAFICMNLPYTMTVASAADAALEFAPKQVYPYHYRGRPDVSDVAEFKRVVNEGNPDIEVVQLDWYPNEPY